MNQGPVEPPLAVVALGGNAMQSPGGDASVAGDFERTAETAGHLVAFAMAGRRLVVTHGNGPQVGNHLLRSELGMEQGGLPYLPLDVCVADTQGGMGYMLQQCLSNAFHERGVARGSDLARDAGDRRFKRPGLRRTIETNRRDDLSGQGGRVSHSSGGHSPRTRRAAGGGASSPPPTRPRS